MMAIRTLIPGGILLGLLGGCASGEPQPDARDDDCFYIRQVNSWDAIDDKHIYIKAPVNDDYLLTMIGSCQGIRFARAIALSNQMDRICPNNFDRITYRDGGIRKSCRIGNVERVGSKDKAKELVESRKSED